jgi:hypothetical protein
LAQVKEKWPPASAADILLPRTSEFELTKIASFGAAVPVMMTETFPPAPADD